MTSAESTLPGHPPVHLAARLLIPRGRGIHFGVQYHCMCTIHVHWIYRFHCSQSVDGPLQFWAPHAGALSPDPDAHCPIHELHYCIVITERSQKCRRRQPNAPGPPKCNSVTSPVAIASRLPFFATPSLSLSPSLSHPLSLLSRHPCYTPPVFFSLSTVYTAAFKRWSTI